MFLKKILLCAGLLCCLLVSNSPFLHAQETNPSPLTPLATDQRKPQDSETVDQDSRLQPTLNVDFDVSPESNFSHDGLVPVIDGWVRKSLSGETLTLNEFRRLSKTVPPRDLAVFAADNLPKRLRPLNVVKDETPAAKDETPSVTVESNELATQPIQDNLVRPVEFQVPITESEPVDDTLPTKSANTDAEKSAEAPPKNEQPATVAETSPIETVKQLIENQKELINSNESIDKDVKTAQLEQLNSASTAIQQATASQALIDFRKSARENFSKDLERLTKLRDTPFKPESPEATMTVDELEIKLQEKRQEFQEQKTKLNEIKGLLEKRENRIKEIPSLRTAVNNRLNTFKKRFEEFVSQPDDQEKQFSTLALNAQQLAAQKENEEPDIDLLYQEQFGKLWILDRDIRTSNIKNLEAEISVWETAISRRREIEVAEQQRQAREAQEKAIRAHPSLKPLAHRNQELAQIRSDLTASIKKTNAEVKRVKKNFEDTESKLDSLKQIGNAGRITTANGMLLVEHRRRLTPTFESQARIQEIKTELQIIRLANLKLTEELENLASTDEVVRDLVSQYESQALPFNISLSHFEKMATELAQTQRTLLKALEGDYDNYLSALAEIETNRLNLINKILETRVYIDEQALWIRSSNPLSLKTDLQESSDAIKSYFDRQSWGDLAEFAKNRMINRPYESAFAGFGMVGLIVVSRRLRQKHD